MSFRMLQLGMMATCLMQGCDSSHVDDSTHSDASSHVDASFRDDDTQSIGGGFCPPIPTTQPEPFDPPLTKQDINRLLQDCVSRILSGSTLHKDGFANDGIVQIRLIADPADWPEDFFPEVSRFRFTRETGSVDEKPADVTLGLHKLDVSAPSWHAFDGNFELSLSFSGPSPGQWKHVGGSLANYHIRRINEIYELKK